MIQPSATLIVLPGSTDTLGGTLVSLALLIQGFKQVNSANQLVVLCSAGSLLEKYLRDAGHGDCLKLIDASTEPEFIRRSLQWINQQPRHYPLLLDNCVARNLMPVLITAAPQLRFSDRPIYFFFHDLAISRNVLGFVLRKLAFTLLSPIALSNSHFTSRYVQRYIKPIADVFYQPVDLEKFQPAPGNVQPPDLIQPILKTGARVMLTPSRINQPGIINDKNLRSLIPVVAHLKARGQFYHSIVIGEDRSPGGRNTQDLLNAAHEAGIGDRFTVLPPTRQIQDYYRHSDVVVTLAPREPFGRTVVEAIACGVPVVGSRTGGIAEILNHFAPEWTVDFTDPAAVAETMLQVQTDRQTQARLAAGQRWVAAECSPVYYARKFMNVTGIQPLQPLPAERLLTQTVEF